MIKKLTLIVLVFIMFTGCSKTVSYKYNEAVSQNGDWSVEKGQISIRDGGDSIKFKVKYIGDSLIDKGQRWSCKVLVCYKNKESSIKESSIDEAEIIFTRLDIYGKEMTEGDTKDVKTEVNDNEIANKNDYDFNSVYLEIEYTEKGEAYEDIIELSSKS